MDIDTVGITEIYAPERVATFSAQYGMKTTFDLTTGWDFTQDDDRRRAWGRVVSEQPQLIIGSPPFTAFSTLQCMNEAKWRKDEDRQKRRQQSWDEAARHVNFCANTYRHQIKNVFYFLHGHPHNASSWGLACMQMLTPRASFGFEATCACSTWPRRTMQAGPCQFASRPNSSRTHGELQMNLIEDVMGGTDIKH